MKFHWKNMKFHSKMGKFHRENYEFFFSRAIKLLSKLAKLKVKLIKCPIKRKIVANLYKIHCKLNKFCKIGKMTPRSFQDGLNTTNDESIRQRGI